MGKVRKVILGDEKAEKEQKRKADARREGKKAKKANAAVVEGTELKAEVKELMEKVEKGEKAGKESKRKKVIGPRVRGKKYREAAKLVDKNKTYTLNEALKLVKLTSITKFDGTVEMHININPLTLGDKKDIRGSVTLPHGSGKQVRVVVADDKILEEIVAGKINFDILVAHPSMMSKLAKVARVLGPKGLMPNPKTGTVTTDIEKRVKELSNGQVNFKSEPENPIIHLAVGKVSFEEVKLKDNVEAVLTAMGKNKILKITLTTTMGPGIKLAL
ncbi:MAG: 50S ribosomal protein L1 [Candidatus Gottesmanbacteria bacterium]